MNISIVAAIADNNVIGKNNQLIWHIPEDLKHFKNLTTGHTIIMGRKTYESIGKALPNRKTIIISRQNNYFATGCIVVPTIDAALLLAKDEKEVFVAGGGEIYRQVINLPCTTRLYITKISADFDGDTLFPDIDPHQWELISEEERLPDDKNPYPYAFQTYKRKV